MVSRSLAEHVYFLGCAMAPIRQATAELVGNKAANLLRMAQAGLPVPPAFVFSTDLCRQFFQQGRHLPDGFDDLLSQAVRQLEKGTGLAFGGERRPLLVSVRSGARESSGSARSSSSTSRGHSRGPRGFARCSSSQGCRSV